MDFAEIIHAEKVDGRPRNHPFGDNRRQRGNRLYHQDTPVISPRKICCIASIHLPVRPLSIF